MSTAGVGTFRYDTPHARVVFGAGTLDGIAAEIRDLGLRRVLVVAAGSNAGTGRRVADLLGAVGTFGEVRPHVPEDLAATAAHTATELAADAVVAVGGGSAIGLAKAVALETGVTVVAVPTTYSGSEATPIYGITGRHKRVGRDVLALPKLVVYDPCLTVGLPPATTAATGFNALAHGVEALYAPGANPVTALHATEAIRLLARSLPACVLAPDDLDARATALLGAYLAGTALAVAGTALHHRLCHVLGGTFGLPHAPTNAAVLPHVVAFNAPAVPAAIGTVAGALGATDAAGGLYGLAGRLGAETSLAALGMPEEGLPAAARRTVEQVGASNPRAVRADAVASLLDDAYHGRPPRPAGAG